MDILVSDTIPVRAAATRYRADPGQPTERLSPVAPGAVLPGGRPAPARTLWDVFRTTADATPTAPAIDTPDVRLDYRGLRHAVEMLAGRLRDLGIGRGDRVGIRAPSGTAGLYVAILAVLSRGAAYVPVDVDDPPDRAELVFTEAAVCAVIAAGNRVLRGPVPARRLPSAGPGPDDDAWVIFTSGSTGTPKGVAVTHRSAAAFVDAEAALFAVERPLGPGDRVVAGLSVAFDASCEEMWLAWRHGACLVPVERGLVRSGGEFGDWLADRRISVVSTVPTLAGLWTADQLAGIRLLVLGGEACPESLAHRLAAACPEVWNTYGPTETTVVASAARLTPAGPVRIGRPLAGWDLAVVDPETGRPVRTGEVGELVISGVGTARYLDRDKDRDRFRPLHSLGWNRAYRSGDLVRADPEGLGFVGRVDGQVKISGFRVELSEIEAALSAVPGVAQAAVTTHESRPSVVELVGYYSVDAGAPPDEREITAQLRSRLPRHMVPAVLEELPRIPTTTSGKVDRTALPAPTGRRGDPGSVVAPATATESVLAEMLADVLGTEAVSVEGHLVDDLGATSLALARFAARVRERYGPSAVGIRQLYLHPTVRALAELVDGADSGPASAQAPDPVVATRAMHLLCGSLQVLVLAVLLAGGSAVAWADVRWIDGATDALELYGRTVTAFAATFVLLVALPVAVKWALVGRWRPGEFPVWSLDHVRFWTVATLVRTSPLALFAGSPLYLMYLRALGARIGRGAAVFSTTVPVCTDLLSIGDDAVVRKDCSFTGYRVHAGVVRTGRVDIGRGAVVADATHLDVDSAVGDGAQLGHASSLAAGQRVPDGQSWHGSPAVRTTTDYRAVPAARCSRRRRTAYALGQLAALLLAGPVPVTAVIELAGNGPRVTGLFDGLPDGDGPLAVLALCFSPGGLGVSLGLGVAVLLLGLAMVGTLPRVLRTLLVPGKVYPLYGVAYRIHRILARLTNIPFFLRLYGDSSYVVGYLRLLGYRASRTAQTGSNFGAELSHEVPHLVTVGAGTMVSDGVGFRTAEFTHCSFRIAPVRLGAGSFLGNALSVPAGDRIGDDCLVGTKTMIPSDGPVRTGVGLLGSPPFEIPRAREADPRGRVGPAVRRTRLAAKNRHNLRTMGLFLLVQWVRAHLLVTAGLVAVSLYTWAGPAAFAAAALATGTVDLLYAAAVERAVTGFRRLRPRYCSIYEPYFWWHERFWKLSTQPSILNGTPLKPVFWRLLGVRVGRRVYDDGASISEKTLVRIGDDATLGAGAILQAHSMEDGVFKSDHIDIGSGTTVGAGAFVHYGTRIDDGAQLGPDSFLMKGERIPPYGLWRGNPAQPVRARDPVPHGTMRS